MQNCWREKKQLKEFILTILLVFKISKLSQLKRVKRISLIICTNNKNLETKTKMMCQSVMEQNKKRLKYEQ